MDEYDDIIAAATAPAPKLRKIVRGAEKLKGATPELIEHWNNLQSEFDKAGVQPKIKSGFRTAEQQNSLHRRGFPTKGNDGYIKRSPHQDGRALDLGFNATQRSKGLAIVADYAKRNNLHVPDDEPWHIAIPKQKAGQSDEDYADVVEAAMGQADNYDDIVAAATPAPTASRFGAPRSKQPVRPKTNSIYAAAQQRARTGTTLPPSRFAGVQAGLGPLTPESGAGALRQKDEPETKRIIEAQRQVAAEPMRRANARLLEGSLSDPEEAARRATEMKAHDLEAAARETERQRIIKSFTPEELAQTKRIADQLRRHGPGVKRGMDKAVQRTASGLLYKLAGLTDIVGPSNTENVLGDTLRRKALAGELAIEDLQDLPQPQREKVAEFLTSLGTGLVEIAATPGGPITKFAGLAGSEAIGRGESAKEIAKETAKGGTVGAVFKHAGRVTTPAKTVAGRAANLGKEGAAIGAGTYGVEKAFGTPDEDALLSAATNTVLHGALGARRLRGVNVPERPETIAAQLDQRGYTLIPKGNPKPPLPRGTRAVKTKDGTVYYDPKRVDAETIRSTPTTELLGHVEPKSETTTEAVVARDPITNTEIQSSAVSPENVAKQAAVTQVQFPEAKVEVGGPEVAAEVIAERVAPQRYRHLEFGDVVKMEDQSGAGKGRVKVHEEGDPSKIHYPKAVDLQGRGNSRMIPIKEAATAIPTAEAAAESTRTAPTPREVIEAAGLKYKGTAELMPRGTVGHQFDVGPDTLTIKGEVTPEMVAAKLAEHAAKKAPTVKVDSQVPSEQSVVESEAVKGDASGRRGISADTEARTTAQARPTTDRAIDSPEGMAQAEVLHLEPQGERVPDAMERPPITGLNRYERGAEGIARDMRDIVAETRRLNAEFLKTKGLTMEQARKLSKVKQEKLQSEYSEWYKNRPPEPPAAESAVPTAREAAPKVTETAPKAAATPELQPATLTKRTLFFSEGAVRDTFRDRAALAKTPEQREALTKEFQDALAAEKKRIDTTNERINAENTEAFFKDPKAVLDELREQAGRSFDLGEMLIGSGIAKVTHKRFGKGQVAHKGTIAEGTLSNFTITAKIGKESLTKEVSSYNDPRDIGRSESLVARELAERIARDSKASDEGGGPLRAATPELQPIADQAAKLRQQATDTNLTSVERSALERKAARLEAKARGEQLRRAGADPYELIDDIIIKGGELYRKTKPKFDAWAKSIKAEFKEAKDKDLREIYAQLSGKHETSSIQNKASAELREDLGLLEMERPESKSWETSIANAQAKGLDKQAEAIADRVIKGGRDEGLDLEESAGILIRTRELENQWEEVYRKNPNDPQLETIKAQLDKFTEAVDIGGTEPARTLNFRKAHIDKEFRLISMIKQAEATKGRKVTPEETARYDAIVKERDQAIKDRDKAIEQLNSKKLQAQLDHASRQRSRAETKEKLDEEAALIRQNIAAEFARLKSSLGRTQSMGGLGALDPDGVITRNLRRYVANRAKAHVGLKAEAVIDEAFELVKDFGVTRRQVAEAIVGFGKPPVDRRSEAAKKLADIRAEITSLLKAEDIATGKVTAKQQGPKRDLVRNNNRLKELQRQEKEWERKFNERDFEPRAKPEPYPYNSEVRKAEDRVKIAEAKFRREMERARPGHQFRNLSGVWKAWLLSGPQTQAMNIGGTGAWQGFREVARLPAAIADAVWSGMRQAAGLPAQRSIQGPSPVAMVESVIEGMGRRGLREFMETMRHGAPKEAMERHQFEEIDFATELAATKDTATRRTIDKVTNSRAVETIALAHNVVFRFMSGSDRVFYQGAYRRNLIDRATIQAKNEGVSNVKERARELIDNPTPELDAAAKYDALVSTFNNDNALSTRIKRARSAVVNPKGLMGKKEAQRLNAAENFALDLILPFDRTPTNVIARLIESSPLGYGKNITQLVAAAMRKSMPIEHQRQMMQTFGNATAGTALMGLGWYLADKAKGLITVDGYDVYLNIPKLPRLNLRTLSPMGNILAAGARARTIHDDPKSSNWDYVKLGLKEPINQPLLRATSSINEIGRDPKVALNKFAGKTASSAIPFSGAARFAGQQIDPADRRYADDSFTEQFKRNVPVSRETLPASRVRLLGSEVTKATKEAERLKINIKGATKQADETDADFEQRAAVVNPTIKAQIEAVVEHPDYDNKSDEDKTRWLKQAAQFATKRAHETIPEKPEQPEETEFPMPQAGDANREGSGLGAAFPADALSKFEKMTPAQRAANRDTMQRKARVLLRDPRLSDEQKAEFKRRLDALGITTRPRRSLRELQATP